MCTFVYICKTEKTMALKKTKRLLTQSVDPSGRVMFPVSMQGEENFELLDFIDKFVDKKKITRNQAIRDVLYAGKAHIIEKGLNTAI